MTLNVEPAASDAVVDLSPMDDVVERSIAVATAVPNVSPKLPVFGAAKAVVALLALLLAQFIAGIVVMVTGMVVGVIRGQNIADHTFVNRLMASAAAPLLLLAALASALTVFGVARLWAWHIVRDKSSDGLGMTYVPKAQVLLWSGVGTVIAMCYIILALWLVPYSGSTPLGPLAAAAAGGPLNRLAFALIALLFAPIVEEFFFRGLLLKGFSTSWGSRIGSIVVTVLFVLLHLSETFRYWPATVAVALMGCGALMARRMTGSLGPAMALHGSYNLVIVVVVLLTPITA